MRAYINGESNTEAYDITSELETINPMAIPNEAVNIDELARKNYKSLIGTQLFTNEFISVLIKEIKTELLFRKQEDQLKVTEEGFEHLGSVREKIIFEGGFIVKDIMLQLTDTNKKHAAIIIADIFTTIPTAETKWLLLLYHYFVTNLYETVLEQIGGRYILGNNDVIDIFNYTDFKIAEIKFTNSVPDKISVTLNFEELNKITFLLKLDMAIITYIRSELHSVESDNSVEELVRILKKY